MSPSLCNKMLSGDKSQYMLPFLYKKNIQCKKCQDNLIRSRWNSFTFSSSTPSAIHDLLLHFLMENKNQTSSPSLNWTVASIVYRLPCFYSCVEVECCGGNAAPCWSFSSYSNLAAARKACCQKFLEKCYYAQWTGEYVNQSTILSFSHFSYSTSSLAARSASHTRRVFIKL